MHKILARVLPDPINIVCYAEYSIGLYMLQIGQDRSVLTDQAALYRDFQHADNIVSGLLAFILAEDRKSAPTSF